MKKTLLAVLLMITSIAAFSQRQPQQNQFRDYVEFQKQQPRPEFGPHRFPMHPKPESIKVKGNKVIVVFKREDFEKLKPVVISRNKPVFVERQRGRMQQRFFNKFEN